MPNPIDFTLYLITDRHQVPAGRTLPETVEAALQGGVRAVQLREKDLSAAELLPLAMEMRDLTRRYGARLLVNDRIDVALAVDADGVHLGGHSLPVAMTRRLLGPDRLIGVSTHHPRGMPLPPQSPVPISSPSARSLPPRRKLVYGDPLGIEPLRAACAAPPCRSSRSAASNLTTFRCCAVAPSMASPLFRRSSPHPIHVLPLTLFPSEPSFSRDPDKRSLARST